MKSLHIIKYTKLICVGLISTLFLKYVFDLVDYEVVIESLNKITFFFGLGIFLVLIINFYIVTLRYQLFLRMFEINLPFRIALAANANGHFISLFIFPIIGHVIGRQKILEKYNVSPISVGVINILEKIITFLVGTIMCISGFIFIIGDQPVIGWFKSNNIFLLFSSIILSVALIGFIARARLIKYGLNANLIKKLVYAFLLTVLAQAIIMLSYVLTASRVGLAASWGDSFSSAAITSFIASLPISINGWGVREYAAIYSFGMIGLPKASALATSILIGALSTLATVTIFIVIKLFINIASNVEKKIVEKRILLEKLGAMTLVILSSTLIFYQFHININGYIININFLDGIALISLSTVGVYFFYKRELPKWAIPNFNKYILVISIVFILGLLIGIDSFGLTRWALVGRIFGWLILLGYLSIWWIVLENLDIYIKKFFLISIAISCSFIVMFTAIYRWFVVQGVINNVISPNFEGFSSNRNAFAFQALVSLLILIVYFGENSKLSSISTPDCLNKPWLRFRLLQTKFLIYCCLSTLIFGVYKSGSRAGILTCAVLLILVAVKKWVSIKKLIVVLVGAVMLALLFQINLFSINTEGLSPLFSSEASNLERWKTLSYGLSMWFDHPFFGAGLGYFNNKSGLWLTESTVIHNTPLWILSEFGLFGFIAIGYSFITPFIFFLKNQSIYLESRIVVLLYTVFLIFSLAHEIFYQRIFWLVLGICIAETIRYNKFPNFNSLPPKLR
jgi:hypothetical protein